MTSRPTYRPLFCRSFGKGLEKETGREGVRAPTGPNHSDTEKEYRMASNSQYGDSTPESNWQSVGSLAARLVEKAKEGRK